MKITLIVHEDGTTDVQREDSTVLDEVTTALSDVKGRSLVQKATNAACSLRSLRADAAIKGKAYTACRQELALTKAAMEILHYAHGKTILDKAMGITKYFDHVKTVCHACAIEAEFATEDTPVYIPYHTCMKERPVEST